MSSKILNVILFCLLSLFIAEKGNAGLIVDDFYSDNKGIQWQYIGSFDLAMGPKLYGSTTPTPVPYNGIEAAVLNFGPLLAGEEYALSSNNVASYANNIGSFIVNHKAWYDSYDFTMGLHEANESLLANNAGGLAYDEIGDIPAFIKDRALLGDNINHVFKTVAVPEPSSFTILLLALAALTIRRLKS